MSNYHDIEEHILVEKDELFFTPSAKSLDWFLPTFLVVCMSISIVYAFCIVKKALEAPKEVSSRMETELDDVAMNKLFVKKKVKRSE
jgi:hypothetical protein